MRGNFSFGLVLASASISVLLVACGGDDDMAVPDLGPPDMGEPDMDLPPSALFGECERDTQCPGVGARCRRPIDGWPNGYCTVPCVPPDTEPCLDADLFYNHCLTDEATGESWCERRCLNGIDCGRTEYTCVGQFPPMDQGMCIGICLSDADCGRGEVCNTGSGRCVASLPTSGAAIGAACADDAACLSNRCYPPVDAVGDATGFLGGYCMTTCILPAGYNGNSFYVGTSLPGGTCPADAICFPNPSFAEGDPGICLDECTAAGDCRAGFECTKDFRLSSGDTASYDNGVCLPISCDTAECPPGSACDNLDTRRQPLYRCGPP